MKSHLTQVLLLSLSFLTWLPDCFSQPSPKPRRYKTIITSIVKKKTKGSLQPEGLTFAKPVELKFHYDGQLLKNTPEDFLWIVTQAGDGSWNAMLKSVVDTGAKTVTIKTAHFSDWALGRFIDLSLNPSSSTLSKGQSVTLIVAGFVRDNTLQEDDELGPFSAYHG